MKKFYTDLDHTETNTQMPPTMAVAVVVAVHHRLTRVRNLPISHCLPFVFQTNNKILAH